MPTFQLLSLFSKLLAWKSHQPNHIFVFVFTAVPSDQPSNQHHHHHQGHPPPEHPPQPPAQEVHQVPPPAPVEGRLVRPARTLVQWCNHSWLYGSKNSFVAHRAFGWSFSSTLFISGRLSPLLVFAATTLYCTIQFKYRTIQYSTLQQCFVHH